MHVSDSKDASSHVAYVTDQMTYHCGCGTRCSISGCLKLQQILEVFALLWVPAVLSHNLLNVCYACQPCVYIQYHIWYCLDCQISEQCRFTSILELVKAVVTAFGLIKVDSDRG